MIQSDQNNVNTHSLSLEQIEEEREKLTQQQNGRAVAGIIGMVAIIIGAIGQIFVLLGLGAVVALISFVLLFGVGTKRTKKLNEQKAAIYEQERQQKQQLWEEGKWEFPCQEFYNVCIEKGVQNIKSTFYLQKAVMIAKNFVPSAYHHIYISEALVSKYFSEGKALEATAKVVRETESRKPRKGKLSEAEYQYVRLSQALRPLLGIDKRISMINDAISRINKKIHDYEEGQKAIREVGFLLSTSVAQEKTKDWAFLGGLAEGLAGPGAGIAVAANAIAENAAIEQRNAQARQAATETIRSLYADASELSTNISDLINEKKLMWHYLSEASEKVVMQQYSTDEIFKKLSFSSSVAKTGEDGGLKLTIIVSNEFKADVPENVRVAVDGTLSAKIYFEGTYVDTVCVSLPLFGVSRKEEVIMYTEQYVEADGIYSVEITPNNLWVVEV